MFADVQALETGELGAFELEQFRLRFGAAVAEGKAGAAPSVSAPLTHCWDTSDADSAHSSPDDAPDLPQEFLRDGSDDSGDDGGCYRIEEEDERRSDDCRSKDANELMWRGAW